MGGEIPKIARKEEVISSVIAYTESTIQLSTRSKDYWLECAKKAGPFLALLSNEPV